MAKRNKKKGLPPRRKRMKRAARLASARHWLPRFEGKNVVRGYAKWFGVDHLCAVKELAILGVSVEPAYVAMLECTRRNKALAKKAKERQAIDEETRRTEGVEDVDDIFAFIAGRTRAATRPFTVQL